MGRASLNMYSMLKYAIDVNSEPGYVFRNQPGRARESLDSFKSATTRLRNWASSNAALRRMRGTVYSTSQGLLVAPHVTSSNRRQSPSFA